MTDLTRKTAADRRTEEQLKILVGERGAEGDRAVRYSELFDASGDLMKQLLGVIETRAGTVIDTQMRVSTGSIRRAVKEGAQAAEDAAERAAAAQTRIEEVNFAINAALTVIGDDFDSITADLAALSTQIDTDIATLDAAIVDLSTSVDAGLALVNTAISDLSGVVDANYTSLSSSIDGVAADLATNYYTGAEVDAGISTAVSALETSLSADIGAVAADLATNYYTIAQTDLEISTAISAAQTTLQANIDSLSATLTTTYYTSVQTDGAISTAITALETSLSTDIDGLAANLSANYYTSVATDGAISSAVSAAQTTLQSNIDGLAANLSANYYTSVATDGAISSAVSAAQTTLQTNIDGLEAYLNSTFYTSVETDGAISTAVSALETSLSAEIDGVAANLAANYYTSAATDSALASLQTALEAQIDGVAGDLASFETYVGSTYATSVTLDSAIAGVEQVIRSELNRATPPTGFTSGDEAWTSDSGGTPEAVAAPSGTWTFSGDAAHQALPTSTTGAMLATRGVVPVSDADTCRITVIAKITGTGAGLNGAEFTFTWLDAAFSVSTLVATQVTATLAPGGFVTLTATADAPPDAFWLRGGMSFDGLSYDPGATVEVQAIKVENLMSIDEIVAGISATFYTKTQTDSAIAAGILTYDATVEGGLAANVTETAVAMADLNGAVARFSVLVSAGSEYNVAGLEVLAWDTGGTSGTAVRLLGDDVIVPGSLTVGGALTVTDGSGELIPNWNFASGDLRGWDATLGTAASVVEKAAGTPALSTANARYCATVPAGGGNHTLDASAQIACAPGQTLAVSYEAALGGTDTGAVASVWIRFYDATDTLLSSTFISAALAGTTWVTTGQTVTVPANAVYFTARLRLQPGASYPIYATNISVIRQRSGAVLITPNSITGAQLITSEALITNAAQIGNALVGSAHIANAAITTAKIGDAQITAAKIGDAQISNVKMTGDIWSDNYAEDGSGNPTAGFKLKRATGTIKGVEFIDRNGIVDGAVNDTGFDTQAGAITVFRDTWTDLISISMGASTGTDFFTIAFSGSMRQYNAGSWNGYPAAKIARRVKTSGVWSAWKDIATVEGMSATLGTYDLFSWSGEIVGTWSDIQYRVQTKVWSGTGMPTSTTLLAKDFTLGYQVARK